MAKQSAKKVETRSVEGETRRQIMLTLLHYGPITVAELGDHLGLSAAGVRRHLDILVEEDIAEPVKVKRPAKRSRGVEPQRGRPAKKFRLTNHGRDQFGHSYDMLASAALRALEKAGGRAAVKEFARERVSEILSGLDLEKLAQCSAEDKAKALVQAFSEHGYASTFSKVQGGVQICQHHCPISQVAAEFPEICEAEHEIVAELTGTHTQNLASITDGHGICTTNIPLTPITHSPQERS